MMEGISSDKHKNKLKEQEMEQEQRKGLRAIREFLQSKTSYDVLPVSFRLIVLDTSLLVKNSLNILLENNVISAPLWNSQKSKFEGLLTSTDFINVIQYYVRFPDTIYLFDELTLNELRDIERAIGVDPIETISIHPFKTLYETCVKMLKSKSRRIPLIDVDDTIDREVVVSVLTQYRILKFVALNCKETKILSKPIKMIPKLSSKKEIATCTMNTPVIDVIFLFTINMISSVPVVDDNNKLINVYEVVDALSLIKDGLYTGFDLTVGTALLKRTDDFEGVHICTENDMISSIMDSIRKSRLHRLFIVDNDGKLVSVITLSDILEYILFDET